MVCMLLDIDEIGNDSKAFKYHVGAMVEFSTDNYVPEFSLYNDSLFTDYSLVTLSIGKEMRELAQDCVFRDCNNYFCVRRMKIV